MQGCTVTIKFAYYPNLTHTLVSKFHSAKLARKGLPVFLIHVQKRLTCSQSMLRMTSISENEMNIQIPLCKVQHFNGILKISLKIFSKKMH